MSQLSSPNPPHLSVAVSMDMAIDGETHQEILEDPALYVSTPFHGLASLGLNHKGVDMRELVEVLQQVRMMLETKNKDVDTQQVSPSVSMDILQPFISTLARLPKVETSSPLSKAEVVEPSPLVVESQAAHHKSQKITTNFLKPGGRRKSKSHTGLEGNKCENCDFWFSLALALLQLLQFQLGDKSGLFGNSIPSQQSTPKPPSQQQSPYQAVQEDFTNRSHHRAHSDSEPNTPNPRRTFHQSIYPIASSNEFNSYNSPKSAPISPKVEQTPIDPLDLHLLESINDHDKELETITLSGNELFTSLVRESCFAPEPFQMLIGTSDTSTKIETPITQFTETPVSGNFQTPVPRSLSSSQKFTDYLSPSPFESNSRNSTDSIPRYPFEEHSEYPSSLQRSPPNESPSRPNFNKLVHPFPICSTSPFREFINNQSAFYANSAQHLSPLGRDKDKENLD